MEPGLSFKGSCPLNQKSETVERRRHVRAGISLWLRTELANRLKQPRVLGVVCRQDDRTVNRGKGLGDAMKVNWR
jgi:hypothetical protein